jgi:tetratricopeptide (TPR) repeat protein
MYPYPFAGIPVWRVAAAAAALTAISLAVLVFWRRCPYLLVGWLWYLGMLVPVIGVVQVGLQAMADRYTYLPQIGLAVALAWLAAGFVASAPRWRVACAAVAAFVLLDLIVVSSQQVAYWHDSKTLWSHTLDHDPDNWMAHHGVGEALSEVYRYDEAIAEFREALKIRPSYALARVSLGRALEHRDARGDIDEAIEQYQRAIRSDPTLADAHYNLGVLLAGRGSDGAAIAEFRMAVKYKPEHANAHYNLAKCLDRQGKHAEAIMCWRDALRLQPENADTVDEVAWRLATSPDSSIRDGRQALELARRAIELSQGEDPRPLSTLAAAYAEVGQFAEAIETAQRAIEIAEQLSERAPSGAARAEIKAVAEDIRAQMKFYRANRPYREPLGKKN